MNFVSKQDIKAPAAHVFQQLADFEFYESYAMRVGAQVERLDVFTQPQPGMSWAISGRYRGKDRDMELTLKSFQPADNLSYMCKTKSLDAEINFDIIPLNRSETRMKVWVEIKAKGLSARVALQSAKLAKKSLDRKFEARIHGFAANIGDKYQG